MHAPSIIVKLVPQFNYFTHMTHILAVPGVPQGISTAEIPQPLDNICIILVTWDPPANSNPSDIARYNIIIVNVTSQNITADSTSAPSVHFLHIIPNCHNDDVYIQIAAVNHFGCEGPNVEVQASLLFTTTEGGSASTSSKYLKVNHGQ